MKNKTIKKYKLNKKKKRLFTLKKGGMYYFYFNSSDNDLKKNVEKVKDSIIKVSDCIKNIFNFISIVSIVSDKTKTVCNDFLLENDGIVNNIIDSTEKTEKDIKSINKLLDDINKNINNNRNDKNQTEITDLIQDVNNALNQHIYIKISEFNNKIDSLIKDEKYKNYKLYIKPLIIIFINEYRKLKENNMKMNSYYNNSEKSVEQNNIIINKYNFNINYKKDYKFEINYENDKDALLSLISSRNTTIDNVITNILVIIDNLNKEYKEKYPFESSSLFSLRTTPTVDKAKFEKNKLLVSIYENINKIKKNINDIYNKKTIKDSSQYLDKNLDVFSENVKKSNNINVYTHQILNKINNALSITNNIYSKIIYIFVDELKTIYNKDNKTMKPIEKEKIINNDQHYKYILNEIYDLIKIEKLIYLLFYKLFFHKLLFPTINRYLLNCNILFSIKEFIKTCDTINAREKLIYFSITTFNNLLKLDEKVDFKYKNSTQVLIEGDIYNEFLNDENLKIPEIIENMSLIFENNSSDLKKQDLEQDLKQDLKQKQEDQLSNKSDEDIKKDLKKNIIENYIYITKLDEIQAINLVTLPHGSAFKSSLKKIIDDITELNNPFKNDDSLSEIIMKDILELLEIKTDNEEEKKIQTQIQNILIKALIVENKSDLEAGGSYKIKKHKNNKSKFISLKIKNKK